MEPITEFVDSDVENRFYDQMTEATMYEDEMYALPFNTDTQILFLIRIIRRGRLCSGRSAIHVGRA